SAIPMRTTKYNLIYHVKGGELHRYQVDDPGTAMRLVPYKGEFYYCKRRDYRVDPDQPRQVWKWEGQTFRRLSQEEGDRIFDDMPVGEKEKLDREGWHKDDQFEPGAFREAEREKVIDLKECEVKLKISKTFHDGKKISACRISASVNGPHASSLEDEFIFEPQDDPSLQVKE